jgi:hypothetical protein
MHEIRHGGVSAAALAVLALSVPLSASAGDLPPEFLGATPYVSPADSPFETDEFGFCIEDFEDGSFDVPGATGNGIVLSPSEIIDSVDADDGIVDGSGSGGHSYFAGNGTTGIQIDFDPQRVHGLPTQVGIVWTDGGFAALVTFEAFDSAGVSLGKLTGVLHADNSNSGETAEDRFYGITTPGEGISRIVITNTGGGIEVDHVQLDHCVLCGDAIPNLDIAASDALVALKTSVGTDDCQACVCDTNSSGGVTASDALAILKKSVGLSVTLTCAPCN